MRLLCVSTSKNTDRILERLTELAAGQVELSLHVGSMESDIKASSMTRMNTRKAGKGHIMRDARFTGAALEAITSEDFQDDIATFVDHLHRRDPSYAYKSHNLRSTQDYLDYYHILVDVIAERFEREAITHCLFFNVPHLAYDTIVFQVAQARGLPCVIVTQSLFPNRYYSMARPQDYGRFDARRAPDARLPIAREENVELFYMKNVGQAPSQKGKPGIKPLLHLITYMALKRPLQAFNPLYWWRTWRQITRVYGYFPDWRDPFARFFHENELAYFEHLAQYESRPVDLNTRFVYFPLQLQPEMTTSALGGRFKDQALAIETLAGLLPPEVKIYVKENPKQGGYMRGPLFFHRLKRIPNVEILPSFANTHALTERAEFVATITGTVGWEAARKGQRALVFGNTWYQNFPGVVKYRPGLRYEDIANAPLDHAALEQAAGALVACCHEGVIDRHYTALVPGLDEAANTDRVAHTLLRLLRGEERFVFGDDLSAPPAATARPA